MLTIIFIFVISLERRGLSQTPSGNGFTFIGKKYLISRLALF